MNTTEEYQLHIFFLCFIDYISPSHCMLISVVGYRPCTYTSVKNKITVHFLLFLNSVPSLQLR